MANQGLGKVCSETLGEKLALNIINQIQLINLLYKQSDLTLHITFPIVILTFIASSYPNLQKVRVLLEKVFFLENLQNLSLIIAAFSYFRKLLQNSLNQSMPLSICIQYHFFIRETHIECRRHLRPSRSHDFHVSFLLAENHIVRKVDLLFVNLRVFAV